MGEDKNAKATAQLPKTDKTSEVFIEQAVSQSLSKNQEKIDDSHRPEHLITNESSIYKSIRNERLRTSLFTCPSAREKPQTRLSSTKSKYSSHHTNVASPVNSDNCNNVSEEIQNINPMVIESTSEMAKIIVDKVLETSIQDFLKVKTSDESKWNAELKNYRYCMPIKIEETTKSWNDYYKNFNTENGQPKDENRLEDEDEDFQIEFQEEPSEYIHTFYLNGFKKKTN